MVPQRRELHRSARPIAVGIEPELAGGLVVDDAVVGVLRRRAEHECAGGEGAGGEAVSPYAAPARAEDLTGLPDTYIDVGSVPFELPLGALLPVRTRNLLPAAKNIGTTHITNGCYRLHPVEWNAGEVAGRPIRTSAAGISMLPWSSRRCAMLGARFNRLSRLRFARRSP